MKFNNRPNTPHKVGDRIIWESRSVAVNGVVILYVPGKQVPYVLVSKRGPKSADYQGYMNLIAGYMDWDESGPEALYREAWEEVGLDLREFAYPEKNGQNSAFLDKVISNDLEQPWYVKTEPDENRQNISLRYGVALKMKESVLPELSLENNEVLGEVENAMWLPVNQLSNYSWAFEHDKVIKEYLARIDHLDKVFRK